VDALAAGVPPLTNPPNKVPTLRKQVDKIVKSAEKHRKIAIRYFSLMGVYL
jgi:hypothetical protein